MRGSEAVAAKAVAARADPGTTPGIPSEMGASTTLHGIEVSVAPAA